MSSSVPPAAPQSVLFAAPHRAMFFAGGLQLVLALLPWAWELVSRVFPLPAPVWPWPPGWGHGLLACYGFFPFFAFGFLLTAMPRWQSLPDTAGAAARGAWCMLACGWLLFYAGFLGATLGLRVAGLVAVLAGWLRVLVLLAPVAFHRGASRKLIERLHPLLTWCGLLVGASGIAAWLMFEGTAEPAWARYSLDAGVWGFLLPVFFSVSHRMVPFFSASVIPNYVMLRPHWVLAVVVVLGLLHLLPAGFGMGRWLWLADLPAAAVCAWLAWRWRPFASRANRLLAMLHLGFAWLPVALLLSGVQGLAAVLGWHVLGLAPLHALTLGYFSTMALAMVSRVTLGHSGARLLADRLSWGLALALQAVTVLRIAAELTGGAGPALLVLAIFGWLAIFALWGVRYLPVHLRPRVDGRPG
jgi:uncharacterized protein involved in response to NO